MEKSKNGLLFLIFSVGYINYLATDTNYKLFVAVTNECSETSNKSSTSENLDQVKLEPDEFHDSMVDISEQIENKSENYESSQNLGKFGENASGSYGKLIFKEAIIVKVANVFIK